MESQQITLQNTGDLTHKWKTIPIMGLVKEVWVDEAGSQICI